MSKVVTTDDEGSEETPCQGQFAELDDLIDWVEAKLGAPTVNVEVKREQYEQLFEGTKRWFITRYAFIKTKMLHIGSRNEIDLSDEVYDVIEINFDDSTSLSSVSETFDIPFIYMFSGTSAGAASYSGTNLLHSLDQSGITQSLQKIEELQKTFNTQGDWDFNLDERVLRIFPDEHNFTKGLMEYVPCDVELKEMLGLSEELFANWFYAEVKEALGNTRGKYDSYPLIGGTRSMDGDSQKSEAQKIKDRVRENINKRQDPPMPIVG